MFYKSKNVLKIIISLRNLSG